MNAEKQIPVGMEPDRQRDGKPHDIRLRAFKHALRGVKLYQFLQKQKDGAGWVLGKQYLRAACSVGANIEEPQSAESRPDFVHKLGIAQKEARESLYWLRLMCASGIVPSRKLNLLMKETQELIAVVGSIILSTKRKRDDAR
jgi:four helix bundle protein